MFGLFVSLATMAAAATLLPWQRTIDAGVLLAKAGLAFFMVWVFLVIALFALTARS